MNKGENVGFVIFIISAVFLLIYGLYRGFQEIKEFDLIAVTLGVLLIIGIVILLVSVIKEQRKSIKQMKKEIKKEDLRP